MYPVAFSAASMLFKTLKKDLQQDFGMIEGLKIVYIQTMEQKLKNLTV